MAQVVDLLDGSERADLCGLSLGGLVALQAALERPERVRRLVLTASFARLPRGLRALQLFLATAARAMPAHAVRRGLAAAVPEPYRSDAARELDLSPAELARVMREGARYDVKDRAERLETPTLVLCGERDRWNAAPARRLAALLPNGRFELVAGAGHVANLDRPAQFTSVLRAFLA